MQRFVPTRRMDRWRAGDLEDTGQIAEAMRRLESEFARAVDNLERLLKPQATRCTHSADQTITTGGNNWQALSWNTEAYKDGDSIIHDESTNPSRFYAPISGDYLLTGVLTWDTNAVGERSSRVLVTLKAGGTSGQPQVKWPAAASGGTRMNLPNGPVRLEQGDYVEVQVWQTSGGDLDVLATDSFVCFRLIGGSEQ